MALFIGTFVNKLDRKGRVSVPAPFRAALAGQSFQGVIAFPSFKHPALQCCGMDRMEQLSNGLNQLALFSDEQDDLATTIFAESRQLPFDPEEGRIVLPTSLIEHAGLGEAAAFVGLGPIFEIWDPEAYERRRAAARQRARDMGLTLKLPREGGQ
ncbi:MAG: division/cell wall cluster transcriptional repressor MraZ [Rhodospirillaceae bacterium]|nr:division/cell wall cluster transcriptional repressor MraZ [Rhodospirillaceae bacterium]